MKYHSKFINNSINNIKNEFLNCMLSLDVISEHYLILRLHCFVSSNRPDVAILSIKYVLLSNSTRFVAFVSGFVFIQLIKNNQFLMSITDYQKCYIYTGIQVHVVYADFEKALDKVCHALLFKKKIG